jgi:t-SNARE complex subunit (syntaxin)
MKIAELFNGLRYMLTREQKEVVDIIKEQPSIARTELSERHQHLAEQMTGLGIIDRIYDEETQTVAYKLFDR